VGKKEFVVVDEKEEKKQYDNIMYLIFNPDSKRLAYAAKVRDKWFVVEDNKEEGKQYDSIGDFIFFNSEWTYFGYIQQDNNKRGYIFMYGHIGDCFIKLVKEERIVFSSSDSFHYLAKKESSIYLAEETIREVAKKIHE